MPNNNNNNIISTFPPKPKSSLENIFKAFLHVGKLDPFIACFLLMRFLCSLRIILHFFYREVKKLGTGDSVVKKSVGTCVATKSFNVVCYVYVNVKQFHL